MPDSPIYVADHQYDRNGYRNDRDLDRAPIVLIGDSFLEGYKITQAELLSNKLADIMGEDVANLAQAGYGPQNQLDVLRDIALGLEPRIVVWVFFEGKRCLRL